jgi:hypothetical protein
LFSPRLLQDNLPDCGVGVFVYCSGNCLFVVGILFSIALRTFLDEAQKPVQKDTYESSSPKNIWMTFVLMGLALPLTGMFQQILQFSLPKDFDMRVLLTSGTLLSKGSMVALVYAAGAVGQLLFGSLADRYSERQMRQEQWGNSCSAAWLTVILSVKFIFLYFY